VTDTLNAAHAGKVDVHQHHVRLLGGNVRRASPRWDERRRNAGSRRAQLGEALARAVIFWRL
jgi:hypothetical protein